MDEIRRREVLQIKDNEEVAANDAYNEALRQQCTEEAAMPIGLGEAQRLQSFLLRLHKCLQSCLSRCQDVYPEHIHNHLGKLTPTVNTRIDELHLEIIQHKPKWMRLLLMA